LSSRLRAAHLHTIPPFSVLRREFGDRPFRLLDIGCGNHQPTKTKRYFPNSVYYGVDIRPDYNNSEADMQAMERFWQIDLTELDFSAIPDAFFDAMVMNHVIEHLLNGDQVLAGLVPKLKAGGIVYVEFPGPRSLHLPSMPGTLNFNDDESHVRLFTASEVTRVLEDNGCRVLASGTRRVWPRVIATPVVMAYHRLRRGTFLGGALWDATGFAEYATARRREQGEVPSA
jgi:trans-aconitate methyltransferase